MTENGIATDDDSRRVAFIEKALEGVQKLYSGWHSGKRVLPLEFAG